MGESPYQTANDVLGRCFDAMLGAPDRFEGNEAMAWGSLLELPILEAAADRLGMTLKHGFEAAFQAPDVPLACSLDGMITPAEPTALRTDPAAGIYVLTDTGSIEVSTTGILEAKLTANAPDDSPPLHRGPLQLQGQMMCTGKTWGAIATLYRGTELRIFVFEAHPGTQDAIARAAFEFQSKLDTYGHTGVKEWYPLASPEDGAKVHSDPKPVTIDLDDRAKQWVAQLLAARDLIKDAEARADALTVKLMDAIGDAEAGTVGAYTVAWPTRSYKAQPEKVVPAKPAYTIRQKTLTVKVAT
jgi:hypothetical protein